MCDLYPCSILTQQSVGKDYLSCACFRESVLESLNLSLSCYGELPDVAVLHTHALTKHGTHSEGTTG